jgi:glycyl-tRNA synthetase beta chain
MEATLLVELLTEELPPKSLARLSEAFRDALVAELKQDGFVDASDGARALATPRRLAILLPKVREVAPDSEVLVKGPSVKAGLDANGEATQALIGFARKRGIAPEQLIRIHDGKQEVFAHRDLAKGSRLETNLELKVEEALKALPIPKVMRWGNGGAQFVRPIHGLIMLHGVRVVEGTVLGLRAGNRTRGHRFMR